MLGPEYADPELDSTPYPDIDMDPTLQYEVVTESVKVEVFYIYKHCIQRRLDTEINFQQRFAHEMQRNASAKSS